MNISTKDIIRKSYHDSQKQKVYDLDWRLTFFIKQNEPCLNKLYGNLSLNADIIELTYKILKDFNIDYVKVDTRSEYKNSFFQINRIGYTTRAYKENDIETVIHEVAHCIHSCLFNFASSQAHGAIYVSILQYLFEKYELISRNDFFNILENKCDNNVKIAVDLIHSFEFISFEEATKIIHGEVENVIDFTTTSSSKFDENYKGICEKTKNVHLLSFNKNTNIATYIIRNPLGYELDFNIFDKLNKEDFSELTIYSSVCKIDEYGSKCTGKYYHRFGFIKASASIIDGEFEIKKEIHIGWSREESIAEIKRLSNIDKMEGFKVKKATSYEDFDFLFEQYVNRFEDSVVRRDVIDF